MKRKLFAVLMAICLIAGMVPATASEQAVLEPTFSDISGHWAEEAIERWAALGVLCGSDGLFRPDASITRAELAVVIDRLVGYPAPEWIADTFKEFDETAWYADAMRKLEAAGILYGGTPFDFVTRERAAVALCSALNLGADAQSEAPFADAEKISDSHRWMLSAMKALGYIKGDEYGCFRPSEPMTRAALVTILSNMLDDAIREPGVVDGADGTDIPKNVAVCAPDVTLKNYTVAGDLCIMGGTAGGTVVLDNVTVGGELVVRGATHLVLKNGCTVENISTRYRGGATIRLSDDTKVHDVLISRGNSVTYGDVSISDTDTALTVSGSFDTMVAGWDIKLTGGGVTYRITGEESGPVPITLAWDCTVREMVLQYIIHVLGEGTVDHCLLQSVRATIADTVKLDPANIIVDIIDDGSSGPI